MSWYENVVTMEEFLNKTFTKVRNNGDEIHFIADDGSEYKMYHEQDCCENVRVEEIIGDLADLIGTPILLSEESSSDASNDKWNTGTRTFYTLATIKGYITIRWLGESNGCYSETVDIVKLK